MHTAEQRLSDEALEECFTRMETLLKAERFSDDEYCKLALSELSKVCQFFIVFTTFSHYRNIYDTVIYTVRDLERNI